MDIDTRSSISAVMRDALRRVDGKAMYLVLIIFLMGVVVLSIRNLLVGDFSFLAWKIVLASVLMLPTVIVLYFGLAAFGTRGDPIGRWISAACLLAIPIYFYLKLI